MVVLRHANFVHPKPVPSTNVVGTQVQIPPTITTLALHNRQNMQVAFDAAQSSLALILHAPHTPPSPEFSAQHVHVIVAFPSFERAREEEPETSPVARWRDIFRTRCNVQATHSPQQPSSIHSMLHVELRVRTAPQLQKKVLGI